MEKQNKERMEVKTDSHIGTNVINVESTSREQTVRCCRCWTLAHLRQALWGFTVVLCVCLSWTGSTQLAKLTLRQLNVPFTLTWFSTSWNCILFPLYYLAHLCWSKERQSIRQRFRWGLAYRCQRKLDLHLISRIDRNMILFLSFLYLFFWLISSWKVFKGCFIFAYVKVFYSVLCFVCACV